MIERDAGFPDIRQCRESDASAMHAFVQGLPPLTAHTAYTYWSLCRYSSDMCFVAETNGSLVGLVTGMVSTAKPITLFIWQLGVARDCRGSGLSDRLLDRIAQAARRVGAECLEFTIERRNPASRKAFERLAKRLGARMVEMGVAGVPEHIQSRENPDVLYRIKMVSGTISRTTGRGN